MRAALRRFDLAIIIPTVALVAAGILMLSTTGDPAETGFDHKAVQQAVFAAIGLVAALVMGFLDYRALNTVAGPAFLLGIIALGAVALFGDASLGARRWFVVGPIVIQPSEITKLAAIIFLARFLAERGERVRSLRTVMISLVLVLIPVALVFVEPDLGSAVVFLAIWLAMVFVAGARWWHLLAPIGIALAAFPFGWFFAQDYMRARFITFFDPASDPLGAGYNVLQARISIGSGGWWGQGIGQGTQSQLEFLRVRDTDFIFSVLGEQLGFVGTLGVIMFFAILVTHAVIISIRARDDFGRYLAIGIAAMLFFQAFVNIGMNAGLMPVTGITLPFVSFGRNSLVITLAAMGVLLSINAHRTLAPHRQQEVQWVTRLDARPGTPPST
jgi:rod shape determining protein RodA